MKLEYLKDISDGGRFKDIQTDELIRLYDFDKRQANLFRDAITINIIQQNLELKLNSLNFIESINCTLLLRVGEEIGIHSENNNNFVCELTSDSFKHMVHLLEPFCDKESTGYQWLCNVVNPIEFLFSPNGKW